MVPFMLAEISTPFLMAWRYFKNDLFLAIFIVPFFFSRIVYIGIYFLPICIEECYKPGVVPAAILFNLMNLYFCYGAALKVWNIYMKKKNAIKQS